MPGPASAAIRPPPATLPPCWPGPTPGPAPPARQLGGRGAAPLRRRPTRPALPPHPPVMQVLLEVDAVRRAGRWGGSSAWASPWSGPSRWPPWPAATPSARSTAAAGRRASPPAPSGSSFAWALRERGLPRRPPSASCRPCPRSSCGRRCPACAGRPAQALRCMGEDGVLVERATVELVLAEGASACLAPVQRTTLPAARPKATCWP